MKVFAVVSLCFLLLQTIEAAFLDFQLVNNGSQKVYVEILATQNYNPVVLQPHATQTVSFLSPFSGRLWGRIDCTTAAQCNDIGPGSTTSIDIAVIGDQTFYDISLEDGFNVPIRMEPINATASGTKCIPLSCTADLTTTCPKELQVVQATKVVACKSACQAFRTDQYCCRGTYATAATCKSASWPVDYAAFFKKGCPDAFSYLFDDHKTTATCPATKYRITFG